MTTAGNVPPGDGVASKSERVEFLKQVIAFNEANVRSYDVKAQISLAAFVLSANPLIAIINTACGQDAVRRVLVISLIVFVATILTYLWVLWPTPPPQERLTEGLGAKGLFYLHDPLSVRGPAYADRLKGLVLEPELTAEALKLSYIRKTKARRFRFALIATLIAYLVVTIGFFAVGRCAF
jgi:hypothetical protein